MSIEDQYAQTISIVYPAIAPSDAYNIPTDRTIRTHVTVSILGETSDIDFTKEEIIAALRKVEWREVSDVQVDKLALFGIKNDFLVMLLSSPAMQANWESVTSALTSAGIATLDRYPNYRPHITLKQNHEGALPVPPSMPPVIKVGFPVLWWGTETVDLS